VKKGTHKIPLLASEKLEATHLKERGGKKPAEEVLLKRAVETTPKKKKPRKRIRLTSQEAGRK